MQISLKKTFSQKRGETLYSYIFRSTLIPNIAVSLLISLFVQLLVPTNSVMISVVYFVSEIFFVFVVTGIAGGFISTKLSVLYQKYKIDNDLLLQTDKVDLIKQISTFPLKLMIIVYIAFFLGGVTATSILNYMQGFAVRYFVLAWICISVFPATVIMRIAQGICSAQAEKIITKHFQNEYFSDYMEGKHYLGASLNFQFLIYVILPFFSAALISCFSFFHYRELLTPSIIIKLICSFAVELGLCSVPAVNFIRNIKSSNVRLQNVIKQLENKKGGEPFYIPVDYFSELSYTAGNVNRISNDYARNYVIHKETQQKVKEAVDKIKSNFIALDTSIDNQIVLIQKIKDKIEETKNITQSVEDHVRENHRIALQTTEHVTFGLESVRQNITKMNEITDANKFSVSGIRTLSNEINSIWEIVNLISGIADRTKIIAFNAELEVATLESENSSFKNVAVNIRALADKIMDLTKEIRSQIQTIQNSSYDLIKQGDTFTTHIKEGNNLTLILESMYKNIKSISEDSVSSSVNITNDIASQVQKRERLLMETQNIESILHELKNVTVKNKIIVSEIYDQTQIKQL